MRCSDVIYRHIATHPHPVKMLARHTNPDIAEGQDSPPSKRKGTPVKRLAIRTHIVGFWP
jgi:hypothetical protein